MLRAATARTMLPTSMNMARRFNMRHYRTSLRTSGKRQATHRRAAAPVCELWARAPTTWWRSSAPSKTLGWSSSPRTKTKGPEGVANGQDQSAQPYRLHVGSRVRTRRMMLGMSQEKLGDALEFSLFSRCKNTKRARTEWGQVQNEASAPPRRRQARAELGCFSEPVWEGNGTRARRFLHPAMSFYDTP